MVDFHGWRMPVQYRSIVEEHRAVREAVGLFDVSHMGEVAVRGAGARAYLNHLVTQNVATLLPGRARYALMCAPDGGVVDDLVICCLKDDDFLVVVNASRREADLAWMTAEAKTWPGVRVADVSDDWALLAVQGPRAAAVMDRLTGGEASPLRRFRFRSTTVGEVPALLSRTGYTGEDGFEVFCPADRADGVWQAVLEAGGPEGIRPAGLGARDSLRLEAALPLYGQDIGPHLSPLAAGLDRFVDWEKGPFVGRDALWAERAAGVPRRLAGLVAQDRGGVPRSGHEVVDPAGRPVGEVTSGAYSPTLGRGIALAAVPADLAAVGQELGIVIRDRAVPSRVVALPFYSRGA
jgi:aminomethyltransferase